MAFFRNNSGATGLEYSLLCMFIAFVILGVVQNIGAKVSADLKQITLSIK